MCPVYGYRVCQFDIVNIIAQSSHFFSLKIENLNIHSARLNQKMYMFMDKMKYWKIKKNVLKIVIIFKVTLGKKKQIIAKM